MVFTPTPPPEFYFSVTNPTFGIDATVFFTLVEFDDFRLTQRAWRDIDCRLVLNSNADFEQLVKLITPEEALTHRILIGSDNHFAVDIGAGAGIGTLVIDTEPFSPFSCCLIRLERPSGYFGTDAAPGLVRATATFREVALL